MPCTWTAPVSTPSTDRPIKGFDLHTGARKWTTLLPSDGVGYLRLAHEAGLAVTFMAKWNAALPGSSGHLHQSLWRGGKSAFQDPSAADGLSKTMRHYIGGQCALMPELTALYSPTINAYKRYVPGVWAPLTATWGVENRTCAVRVIGAGY